MRRIATVLPMLLVAACDEPRHLWPLDLADTALRTASFAIVSARANALPIEEPSAPTVYQPDVEEPAPVREETQDALPRSDDEIVLEEEPPLEEPPLEEVAEEEPAEAVPDDAQPEEARRLQAMQEQLAAIEEQLRQQELTNEAIAAVLIVHMQRITLTQLTLAMALGGTTKR
jgi:hypothetical protein